MLQTFTTMSRRTNSSVHNYPEAKAKAKAWTLEAKAKAKAGIPEAKAKAKDTKLCPRGASRPRPGLEDYITGMTHKGAASEKSI